MTDVGAMSALAHERQNSTRASLVRFRMRSDQLNLAWLSSASQPDQAIARVATRYDKPAATCLAFVQLASIRLWLRARESAS
jgi:transposase